MTALLKTTYKIRAALLTLGTGLMICSSCTDEDFVKSPQNGDRMSFGVSISDQWTAGHSTRSAEPQQPKYEAYQFDNSEKWVVAADEPCIDGTSFGNTRPTTRAAEVGENNFKTTYSSFGVYAFASSTATGDDDWNQTDAGTKLYISGEQATDPTNDIWSTIDAHYWPGADYRMKFFAWAPYNNSALKVTLNADNTPEFEYTVPNDVSKQSDVLFATDINEGTKDSPNYKETVAGNYNQPVPLRFRHALTAVKVKAAGLEGTITKVTFRNIYSHGSLSFLGDAWAVDNKKDFSANPNKELTGTSDDGEYIINDEYTFMMLPQELTAETKLEVAVRYKDGTTETLQGGIGGTTADGKKHVDWEMGRTVTYTISKTGEITEFYIAGENGKPISEFQFDNNGGKRSFKVYSFNNDNGIPWKIERVEGSVDMLGYDKWWDNNDWRNLWKGDGSSSGEDRACDVSKLPEGYMSVSSELDIPNNVNGQYWDLSLPTPKDINNPNQDHNISQRTTANCYIVNCQNDFIFPAIYGNAIKNGGTNESAYKGKNFVDYSGNIITSPYMDDKIDKVEVEWQDVSHFIEYVEIVSWGNLKNQINVGNTGSIQEEDKRKYIKCHWRAESQSDLGGFQIRQGNAVVSASDKNGNKIWSWHLWISNIGGQTLTRGNYQFLPYNLGWTGGVVNGFREATIHFIQEETGKTCSLKLKQGNKNDTGLAASNLHYQWGRKDPFECDDRNLYKPENRNKVETPFSYKNGTGAVNLGTQIDPICFYPATTGNWWIGNISNLWCADIKTVYDPCPRGFMVPTQEALRQIMGELPEAGMRTNQNIYSPDGSFYWGADYNDGLPDYIGSEKGKYNPAYGFSIRPMREPE